MDTRIETVLWSCWITKVTHSLRIGRLSPSSRSGCLYSALSSANPEVKSLLFENSNAYVSLVGKKIVQTLAWAWNYTEIVLSIMSSVKLDNTTLSFDRNALFKNCEYLSGWWTVFMDRNLLSLAFSLPSMLNHESICNLNDSSSGLPLAVTVVLFSARLGVLACTWAFGLSTQPQAPSV